MAKQDPRECKGYQFIISAPFDFCTPNIWAPLDYTSKTDKQ